MACFCWFPPLTHLTDFFLLLRMTMGMKELRFDNIHDFKKKTLKKLTDEQISNDGISVTQYIKCNGETLNGVKLISKKIEICSG